MAKCIDCAWFPWKPGADVSSLPTMNCYPGSPRRRWTADGVKSEHSCERFKPRVVVNPSPEIVAEMVPEAAAQPGPESRKPEKASKRRR